MSSKYQLIALFYSLWNYRKREMKLDWTLVGEDFGIFRRKVF